MYILYGVYENGKTTVAQFSSRELAENYVKGATLPNGKFKRRSLLAGYYNYEIDYATPLELNPDPNIPSYTEYVVVTTETINGNPNRIRTMNINCGSKRAYAEKEAEHFKKAGIPFQIIEQEV